MTVRLRRVFFVPYLCLTIRVLCWQKPFSPKYPPLRRYNIDSKQVSISGLSAGGAFAAYMAFIYSSLFSGVGVFAGAGYPVAYLVYSGQLTSLFKLNKTYPIINQWAHEGFIDPVVNLRRMRAYLFQGSKDLTVNKKFVFDAEREFIHYGEAVKSSIHKIKTWHCVPTDNFPPNGDYVPRVGSAGGVCNAGYQGINHMFHHFYGHSFIWPQRNNATATGQLFKFDQNEFFKDQHAEGAKFNNAGSIYVPRACQWNQIVCRLHVALHGAIQPFAVRFFADGYNEFLQNSGYLQAADANNIVVLFPETAPANLFAWDIFGWTGKSFLWKNGSHPLAIAEMVARLVYGI